MGHVSIVEREGVSVLTLDRPPANAMDLALPCPVVCAITGHAIAGGMVLALCGDHRVAATEVRYGLTEVEVGVPYPQAAIGVVRAELPAPAARVLALGNRLVAYQRRARSAPGRMGSGDLTVPKGQR